MKNFIQNGDTVTLTAPHNIASGSGILVGNIFGIACNDALAGSGVEVKLTGVFSMPKVATESWAPGSLVYWSQALSIATSVPMQNQLIGVALSTSPNPSSLGTVRLNGAFTATVDFEEDGMESGLNGAIKKK